MKFLAPMTLVLVSFSCSQLVVAQNQGRFESVDIAKGFNQKLDEAFHNPELVGHDLSNLPKGKQLFHGIPFEIGEGCLQLGSSRQLLADMPKKLGPFPIGSECKSMHFLHSAAYGRPAWTRPGSTIGEYAIEYDDGSEEVLEIVLGRNVCDWGAKSATPEACIAWQGSAPDGMAVELLATSWANPHPDKRIKSLVMKTSGKTQSGPFCLAITLDRESDGIDYEQVAIAQDRSSLQGVWERRRGDDESVSWIKQEMFFGSGKSTLTAFGGGGEILWKNESEYALKRVGEVRVCEVGNIRAVEGNNTGSTWPGPFKQVYTFHDGSLVTVDGIKVDEGNRPRVNFWSRKPE